MININELDLRNMQKEAAKALATMKANNNNIQQFNEKAHHDSQLWYKAVIEWYIDQHGDLPSKVGPAKDINLILE